MIMLSIALHVVAIVLFAIAAARAEPPTPPRNYIAAGLAFWCAATLIPVLGPLTR